MTGKNKKYKKSTLAIHAGQAPDPVFGAVAPPIYQTSTFAFVNPAQGAARFSGKEEGYVYTRMGNPTTTMLQDNISALEGGAGALATASGMAATSTLFFALLSQGDHMIGTDAVYGPTRVVMERDFSRFGVESSFVDTSNLDEIEKAIRPETKLLYIETPANPTMKLTDIRACAGIAGKHGLLLIVDNTFMSPILQRPLELGADIVMHSMTKFLNGHTDVVGGIIIPATEELLNKIKPVLFYLGGTIDPNQAWLVLRGVKSLALRVLKGQENAAEVAVFLQDHPAVKWVNYPGLETYSQRELASKQMDGPGSLLAFSLKGGFKAGETMLENVELATLAVSLGGIESLIQHPASMTHAAMKETDRRKAGISDGLIRLSVGCEDLEDIIDDLRQALEAPA